MGETLPTRRRRALVPALVLLAGVLLLGVGPATARASSHNATVMLSISGHGFGQGLGLSQWGAEERARAGQSTSQILDFYYPGTKIGQTRVRTVRVLIGRWRRVVIAGGGGIVVRSADGQDATSAARRLTFEARARATSAYPLELTPRTSPITIDGRPYPGLVTLERSGDSLLVVNDVSLADYIGGVVSAECPGSWRPAALQAQAIAARSYAVANLHPGGAFDLYSDNRSQNYHGLTDESPAALAAAKATGSRVLTFDGRIIEAFFSAADGGRTNDSVAAWKVADVPYLVSRPDPFDALSPDTEWGPVLISLSDLRRRLPQVPTNVISVRVLRNDAGRARVVVFAGAGGEHVSVDGYRFQQRLGLRSTYFSSVEVQV
jgi:stage II sporulation protein D